ncbi:MAG: hypothetical protein K2K53_12450, partial [Oscillospiraceae bacterium]|nr:hypothetical protein [Oscillospiraceae bacterium]
MAELNIYRGADQIGGCTEISAGGERILIDFGATPPPGGGAGIRGPAPAARAAGLGTGRRLGRRWFG